MDESTPRDDASSRPPTLNAPAPPGFMAYSTFSQHLEGRGFADRSVREYARVVRRADGWLREQLGLPIEAATPAEIRAWSDTLPYTWSTRKQARTALRHWQEWLHHREDLAGAVRAPRKPKMQSRSLSDRDAVILERAALESGRRGLAVLLGLYLGMRCVEIAGATWTGYDGAHWTWQRAKTGDVATLPVHPRLRVALDREERWGPYLFPTANTARPHVATQTVWQWVRRIGDGCGVDVSTHQLRHTCITRIVDSVGLRVGQEWAGHRDPEVTAGYSNVPQQRLQEAMQSLAWPEPDTDSDATVRPIRRGAGVERGAGA